MMMSLRCSPTSDHPLIFGSHHISFKLLIFLNKFDFFLRMLVYFFILFFDDLGHFLYFFLQLAVLAIHPNHYFFIGLIDLTLL